MAPFWAMFWTMLVALLYYPAERPPTGSKVGDIIDAIEHSGIDLEFQSRARGLLTPDSSVLFLIIEHVPVEMVVEALERFGGTVLQTPLTEETQDRLQRVLHGRGVIGQ
jgi:uncharacterized membrane protein